MGVGGGSLNANISAGASAGWGLSPMPCYRGASLVGPQAWALAEVASPLLHAEEWALVAGCRLSIIGWDQAGKVAKAVG